LEELFHGVNLKEMFVFREFVGESAINLDEYWCFSGSFSSSKLGSEDNDSIKSVSVFLELLDEKLVGFTSGDIKFDKFVSDSDESVIDPVEVVLGVLDFRFNPFSVCNCFIVKVMIVVHNGSVISNLLGTINLLLLPTGIMFILFFIDGILKFKEKLFNSVDSIRGSGISHHHVINLSVEAGCVSVDAD